MRALFSLVVCFFLIGVAFGQSPFQPHIRDRFLSVERGSVKLIKAKYEFSSTVASGATVNLGKSLPARAIVTRNYFSIGDTAVTAASDNTLALGCGATDNLKSATDFTDAAAHSLVDGAATGASSAMVVIGSSACDVTYTVGSGASGITAGKITAFIEYVLGDFATE